jgi:hypothetical protein
MQGVEGSNEMDPPPYLLEVITIYDIELVASFGRPSNLLK